MGSASKQERSAETHAAEQPRLAEQVMCEAMPAAPESQPPPGTSTAASKEEAGSNRSSSLSPQPSLELHSGLFLAPEEPVLPGWAAPAAQEEEPWREVKVNRRKPVSQQASSNASAQQMPHQGLPYEASSYEQVRMLACIGSLARQPKHIMPMK